DIDFGARGGTTYATFLGSSREGKRLPYAPLGTFSGTVDVDAPFGVGAGFAASWTGGFYTDEANTIEPDATGRVGWVDGYVQLDASARYREKATGLGATVTLKNLLDQPFVIARRPEGIWTSGFRQIILGLSWNVPTKR
ncbi:MAG: TonB-dependent receptor, partial [Myxococcales bacterium]|nr:TonB-dependent receptor [Myxococcales bacterium]